MPRISIQPQRIDIAAPVDLVFAIASTADYGYRPRARYTERVLRREGQRLLVHAALQGQPAALKELAALPPDRIRARHLSGPVVGAVEEMHLVPTATGTQAALSADFWVDAGVNSQVRKLHLEHQGSEQLYELRAAAQQRVGTRPTRAVALPWDEPLPAVATEYDLQRRVEQQEEEEFGHVGHGQGVARIAVSLALASGLMAGQVEQVRRAALLHDAGKIAVDSALWGLRGPLSDWQRSLMEVHVSLGHELASRAGLPEEVVSAILYHHERWDGLGYPDRLSGEGIPLPARILAVAEVVDSMLRASYRRPPLQAAQAATLLDSGANGRWDPRIAVHAARMLRPHP